MIYFNSETVQVALKLAHDDRYPRPAWTYRARRRNDDRMIRKCDEAKAERIALGLTRREHDRYRFLKAQAGL